MKRKYLLSTGITTDKIEYYIIDLFKLYLSVYPGDIPNAEYIGFDFIIVDVKKSDLISNIKHRIDLLIGKLREKIQNVTISLVEAALINETTIKIIIEVNQIKSEEILVDLYKNDKNL